MPRYSVPALIEEPGTVGYIMLPSSSTTVFLSPALSRAVKEIAALSGTDERAALAGVIGRQRQLARYVSRGAKILVARDGEPTVELILHHHR